jgi:tRNA(Ile)-lysidine synthase
MTRVPHLDSGALHPGMRVAVAVSGGGDSVGLLRVLAAAASQIGLVLSVSHVHHGIRGVEAEDDARFVSELAAGLGMPFLLQRVNTPDHVRKQRQTVEEAARELRYAWFRELMSTGKVDAVATGHTRDDQAETVLHRLLRGAWTEGLGGIHPIVTCPRGAILRPFLETRREDIRAWLVAIGQPWREDASNLDTMFTRNRIRHELLPQMAAFNPRVVEQLAHLATIARDEQNWWDAELSRLLPGIVLPGKPVRGGGRAVTTRPDEGSVGMETARLRELAPAMRRRVFRAAAQQLGFTLNFAQTERLMELCRSERPRREQLASGLRADKSPRELRLVHAADSETKDSPEEVQLPIPGEATGFGITVRSRSSGGKSPDFAPATLRGPRPGDRIRLRHARSRKPLKEIFERMNVTGDERRKWPLLEWQGRIVWMKDVALEPDPELPFEVEMVTNTGEAPAQ